MINVYPRMIAIKPPPPSGVDVAPPIATDRAAGRPIAERAPEALYQIFDS